MKRGFTLIEIIIVIIIVGILAALGISQYSKTVEKSRGAEARMIIGQMRKLAYEYYLENGTTTGITNAYLNIGTAPDQIPGPAEANCRNTHYFYYYSSDAVSNPVFRGIAWRCRANGKTPQWTSDQANIFLESNFATGNDVWSSTYW